MSQKNALILAAAVSAFILVVLGGLAAGITLISSGPLLNLQPATAQDNALQGNAAQAAAAPAADTAALSPEQAAAIALNIAPGSRVLKTPELVSTQGATAYEVTLDTGRVYINANTGAVLATDFPTNNSTSFFGEREEHEEHEHEHFEHEGDD